MCLADSIESQCVSQHTDVCLATLFSFSQRETRVISSVRLVTYAYVDFARGSRSSFDRGTRRNVCRRCQPERRESQSSSFTMFLEVRANLAGENLVRNARVEISVFYYRRAQANLVDVSRADRCPTIERTRTEGDVCRLASHPQRADPRSRRTTFSYCERLSAARKSLVISVRLELVATQMALQTWYHVVPQRRKKVNFINKYD